MASTESPHPSPQSNTVTEDPDDIIIIAARGDLLLSIRHDTATSTATHRYRVHAPTLRAHSKYFAKSLQGRFGEGERVEKAHIRLREQYGSLEEVPSGRLPIVELEDVGRISSVKSAEALCKDFLMILHGRDLQTFPPVANLANLAIVADRFDALEAVRAYVSRKKIIRAIDGKTTSKTENMLSEEKTRQRLLVALLLDHGLWLEKYSARMITKGWVDNDINERDALWWDLPSRLEEELAFRRECILETLQSFQTHFVRLYTSRERQCRLGYDSSAACDSFQLGEMIRFLSRIGTLQIQGTMLDTTDPPMPFGGDLYSLIENLRRAPEYQLPHHTHCGIRTRLIPLLDMITESLQHVGLCPECWSALRMDHAWIEAKRPLIWKKQSFRLRNVGHGELHTNIRALFTAGERDWGA